MNILKYKPRKLLDFWKHTADGKILTGSFEGTFELDEISSFLWEKCDGQNTVEEIIADLARLCEISAENELEGMRNDILELLRNWQQDRLIILNYNPLSAFSEYEDKNVEEIEIDHPDVDVLLIVPPSPNPSSGMNNQVQKTFPLGIGYLSSILKKHNYKVEILNLWIRGVNERVFKEALRRTNPKILGISTMTDNFLNGVRLAEAAKELKRDIIIIFGGPHVTFTDEESMSKHPVIDIIVRNEGEHAIVELADCLIKKNRELKDIKGISYKENGLFKRTAHRPFIHDLDDIPFPARPRPEPSKSFPVNIQTARGCPGACIFCVASTMSGGRYRVRSAGNVADEITNLYREGVREFFFQDDTFTVDFERMKEIFRLLKEKNVTDIIWSAESRVDVIDQYPEVYQFMASNGCEMLQFGIEAGSQDTLDHLKKNVNVDQIFRSVKAARRAGIKVVCSMLMGHPFDTEDSIKISVEFAKQLISLGAIALFAIVCPYPGTQIRKRSDFYKIKIHNTSYDDYFVSNAFVDIEHLSAKQIRAFYFDGLREVISTLVPLNPRKLNGLQTVVPHG